MVPGSDGRKKKKFETACITSSSLLQERNAIMCVDIFENPFR